MFYNKGVFGNFAKFRSWRLKETPRTPYNETPYGRVWLFISCKTKFKKNFFLKKYVFIKYKLFAEKMFL